ncbi:MAG: helix-turn-helix domain-containing protein [Acidimicrobiales bacterium]
MSIRTESSDQHRTEGTPIALHRVPLGNARLLFTPEEVAQALAIGRSKVHDLLRSEEMSSVRIGGSRRIPVAALPRICRSAVLYPGRPDGNDPHGVGGARQAHVTTGKRRRPHSPTS